ncbi:CRISPR-associated protein Cas4 [Candidatus Woesearchaeota archaeon]|nr:CRISPR-associated protein Cas4 [Candidatus Woesearchaeota archaeon]
MNTIDILIVGAGAILLILFLLLRLTRVPTQVYKNKSVYFDHKEKPIEALFSSKYGLVGKPDFILHTKDGLLPLEIKHSRKPHQPYPSHVMQLISYCLLIEETKGTKPRYGFLQYRNGNPFYIPYTEEKKIFLIKTMGKMRGYIDSGECPKQTGYSKCKKSHGNQDKGQIL